MQEAALMPGKAAGSVLKAGVTLCQGWVARAGVSAKLCPGGWRCGEGQGVLLGGIKVPSPPPASPRTPCTAEEDEGRSAQRGPALHHPAVHPGGCAGISRSIAGSKWRVSPAWGTQTRASEEGCGRCHKFCWAHTLPPMATKLLGIPVCPRTCQCAPVHSHAPPADPQNIPAPQCFPRYAPLPRASIAFLSIPSQLTTPQCTPGYPRTQPLPQDLHCFLCPNTQAHAPHFPWSHLPKDPIAFSASQCTQVCPSPNLSPQLPLSVRVDDVLQQKRQLPELPDAEVIVQPSPLFPVRNIRASPAPQRLLDPGASLCSLGGQNVDLREENRGDCP
ncbi:uncharacterized protein [Patagioenas fasciata]|uniref:uncharacterized protein isoform X1 n=1 Tax=Patagioenas fasciata TaxID=372321 RepID=UPI003A9905B1